MLYMTSQTKNFFTKIKQIQNNAALAIIDAIRETSQTKLNLNWDLNP